MRSVAVLGLWLVACAFSSPGQGQPGGATLGGDDIGGSAGDDAEGTATDDASDEDEGGSGDGTAGLPDADTGDEGPPVVGGAVVVFAAGDAVDFGDVNLGAGAPLPALELRNDGEGLATGLGAAAPEAPFAWAGGSFPGSGGTCGTELAGGESCTVVLAPLPQPIGLSTRLVTVDYADAGVAEQASVTLTLGGMGTTENLLVNGSFEDGAPGSFPAPWTGDGGNWQSTNSDSYDGSRSGYAGSAPYYETIRLWQEVDFSPWAETLAATGMGCLLDGSARTQSGDSDTARVRLVELDGAGAELKVSETDWVDSNSWWQFTHAQPCAPGIGRVRVELQCYKNTGTDCSAWFDSVRVRLVYPPPG